MPESFPITWPDPADATVMWRRDKWHFPDPATPLTGDMFALSGRGFSRVMATQGAPVRMEFRRINTYLYAGIRPPRPTDPAPNTAQRIPDRFENHAAWDNEWLPEVQGYHEQWRQFHAAPRSAGELLAHIEQALEWNVRCWEIHSLLGFQNEALMAFCGRELGWNMPKTARLLAGIDNKSLESDGRLRELAAMVRESEPLRAAITANPPAEALAALPDGRDSAAFKEALDRFVAEFGMRSDNLHELALPAWIEDPAPVIALVRAYVTHGERDYHEKRAQLAAEREAATAEARALLASKPAEVQEEFERELVYGLRASELNETHNYWIDQQVLYWLRRDFLAAGGHLAAAGVLESANDVFYLHAAEVTDALRGDSTPRQAAVTERKAEMAHFGSFEPPMELGVPIPRPIAAGMELAFGGHVASGGEGELRGQPGSPGKVTGTARIIVSLMEADRLEPGDILVAATTSPPWTPLFGIAGAIVTDAGGAMSHCAIVAREYGIPAVVGCVNATERITDGATITVDGDAGVVTLEG